MKNYLFLLMLITACHTAFAQGDFTTIKEQHIIAGRHIKQITCLQFIDSTCTAPGLPVDNIVFNKLGRIISRKANGYTYSYEYNIEGRLLQENTFTKNKADTGLTVYKYDARGNVVLLVPVKKLPGVRGMYADHVLHKFEYNAQNQLVREYWVNLKGHEQQITRYKCITTGLEPELQKVIDIYDDHDKLTFIKKYYKNNHVNDYNFDNGKQTLAAQSVLNANGDMLKFVDYYHRDTRSIDLVAKMGHGIISTDTLTEVYQYTPYGFCAQKQTYQHNKLTGTLKWVFKK